MGARTPVPRISPGSWARVVIAVRGGPFFQPETKIFGLTFSSENVVSNEIMYLLEEVLEEKDALRPCLLSPEV